MCYKLLRLLASLDLLQHHMMVDWNDGNESNDN